MSVRLITEVLQLFAARPDLTPAERLVLVLVAERANERTRQAWPGGQDDWSLATLLGVSPRRLREILAGLAAKGLDVRVALGKDADGRPVYGVWNRQATYQLPDIGGGIPPPTDDAQAAESRPLLGGGNPSHRRRESVAQAAENGRVGGGNPSHRRRDPAPLSVKVPQDRQVPEGPSRNNSALRARSAEATRAQRAGKVLAAIKERDDSLSSDATPEGCAGKLYFSAIDAVHYSRKLGPSFAEDFLATYGDGKPAQALKFIRESGAADFAEAIATEWEAFREESAEVFVFETLMNATQWRAPEAAVVRAGEAEGFTAAAVLAVQRDPAMGIDRERHEDGYLWELRDLSEFRDAAPPASAQRSKPNHADSP